MAKAKVEKELQITVKPINIKHVVARVRGTSYYIANKFSSRVLKELFDKEQDPSGQVKRKKREARDYDAIWKETVHYSVDGWVGMPTTSFRAAMLDSCILCGIQKTKAKQLLDIVPDGYEASLDDVTPLVKVIKGEFKKQVATCRQPDKGVLLITPRGVLEPGWEADVTIEFDADKLTVSDVYNLLARGGKQCGIGAGRRNSKRSYGIGAGYFEVIDG